MKNRRKIAALLTGLAILIFASPVFAATTTITGKVNKDMTFQAQDGTVYDIAEDDMGETVMVYAGKTVQITGVQGDEIGMAGERAKGGACAVERICIR
jgi:hypothetical protein